MHRSRLCAVLIDCKTSNVDEAARFWSEALGRPVDKAHPSSRGNYPHAGDPTRRAYRRGPAGGPRRVRVHLDIETDDIPAEVARLEKLGAKVVNRLERWVVMQWPTWPATSSALVRVQRPAALPEECEFLGLNMGSAISPVLLACVLQRMGLRGRPPLAAGSSTAKGLLSR